MIITYIPNADPTLARLKVVDEHITGLMSFTSVEATVTLNCGTEMVQEYSAASMADTANKFYIVLADLAFYFKPEMWGLTEFVDGVYRIILKGNQAAGGYIMLENCLFVDITYKCKVAVLLDEVITNKTSTTAHLLHYSLVNGSNCGCNCDAMCVNFDALCGILGNSQAVINNDCGCY